MVLRTLPPILRLPQEILDTILEEVDLHADLVNLALCSQACAALVIPRHSEYRLIRIRGSASAVWAHLARRADLTRSIREVHIAETDDHTAPDHIPSTLLEGGPSPNDDENMRIINICVALKHMQHLKVFSWSSVKQLPTMSWNHELAVMMILKQKTEIEDLCLRGMFASRAPRVSLDRTSFRYPLWRFSGLKRLVLQGQHWIRPSHALHLNAMLTLSPGLQYLELPMELSVVANCRFPELKSFRLVLESGATAWVDKAWSTFIEHHPTIEELHWYPIGPISLSDNCLPAVRAVQCSNRVLEALDGPRKIETLDLLFDQQVNDPIAWCKAVDGSTLHKLRIHDILMPDLPEQLDLDTIFPNLTWLAIYAHSAMGTPDEWVDFLGRFPKLQVFRGPQLWEAVDKNLDRMHLLIMDLVQRCPELRELDHRNMDHKRQAWKRIVIIREGEAKQNVRYVIERPPQRVALFDSWNEIYV
ncbi:hypothetical protein C8J56DRAFT_852869 [Mycena floridula]|nr:hypothetical protein C8J56DRAFT_852869 [Mycena floridula]